MLEKLKELFCIHRFVAIEKGVTSDNFYKIYTYCEKCGKTKLIIIK